MDEFFKQIYQPPKTFVSPPSSESSQPEQDLEGTELWAKERLRDAFLTAGLTLFGILSATACYHLDIDLMTLANIGSATHSGTVSVGLFYDYMVASNEAKELKQQISNQRLQNRNIYNSQSFP
jgi:hypothetical protein